MNKIYNKKSASIRAQIDASVATATAADMDLARKACDAVSRGYFFDFEELRENHPKAHKVAALFLS